jgi:hypothetical protein
MKTKTLSSHPRSTTTAAAASAVYTTSAGMGSTTTNAVFTSRPSNPNVGETHFNSNSFTYETWDGTQWNAVPSTGVGYSQPSWGGSGGGIVYGPTTSTYTNDTTWLDTNKRVHDRLDKIEERLAILVEDEEGMSKFPALREAYDHYKLIEKLCKGEQKKT